MAGLGSMYAGLGLAQGLSAIPQAYMKGMQDLEQKKMAALSRERLVKQYDREDKQSALLDRIGKLGDDIAKAQAGTTSEVDVTEPDENATLKPRQTLESNLDEETKDAMGAAQPQLKTRKVSKTSINYDELKELERQRGMLYQQAALYDPNVLRLYEYQQKQNESLRMKNFSSKLINRDFEGASNEIKLLTGDDYTFSTAVDESGEPGIKITAKDGTEIIRPLSEAVLYSNPDKLFELDRAIKALRDKNKKEREESDYKRREDAKVATKRDELNNAARRDLLGLSIGSREAIAEAKKQQQFGGTVFYNADKKQVSHQDLPIPLRDLITDYVKGKKGLTHDKVVKAFERMGYEYKYNPPVSKAATIRVKTDTGVIVNGTFDQVIDALQKSGYSEDEINKLLQSGTSE